MKKYLLLAMAFASTTALANTQANTNATKEDKPPMMALTTVDVSGKVAKALNSRTYSLSKATKTELCWEVINVPFTAQNKVVEIFQSPDSAKFTAQGASVLSQDDNRTHIITTYLPSINNEVIRKCWKFDKTDPIGTYNIHVQINDVTFPTQTFVIEK